jgi:uncharacterized membrane protein YhaH (DUF805 family)
MRGEVLHYDEEQAFGFITGADGNRYTFELGDLRRPAPVSRGTLVEFQAEGGHARQIFLLRDNLGHPAEAAASGPNHFGRLATREEAVATGLWGYFHRGITENYVNFRGRARRKEYWGFYLFWLIACAVVVGTGLVIDGGLGNFDAGSQWPEASLAASGVFILATFLPGLAMTIRRQHDIGLSGWFYLLIFVPYVGSLIIFVFTLIPSQKHENKWGPIPAGIRI